MERDYVRDVYGRVIGIYDTDDSGKEILRDRYGRILGSYDPKDNCTRDIYGRILGHGNTLSRLLD